MGGTVRGGGGSLCNDTCWLVPPHHYMRALRPIRLLRACRNSQPGPTLPACCPSLTGPARPQYFTDPDVRATVRQSDIRLSRLPGSELVWQRGGGSGAAGDGGSRGLVPCSTGLCPYGRYGWDPHTLW